MQRKNIVNVEDYKKEDGSWCKSYTKNVDNVSYIHHTRSSVLWNNINGRCGHGKAQNKDHYRRAENLFESYDSFTDWCQVQYGYMYKDSFGKFWCLDKDLLVWGNKAYSPETCMFVPTHINNIFLSSDVCRGDLPVGVRKKFQSKVVRYLAECSRSEDDRYLGIYSTPEEAHRAWQTAKVQRILTEASKYPEHIKMVGALEGHAQRIQDDIDNGRETVIAWWN